MTGRHYGMDWLRIGAFGLLILYHVGMAFVPWPFEIKMGPPLTWTEVPMLATNPWRLSLLFAVSGYASAALLQRDRDRPGKFLRGRMTRLGLPLLFGMAVLVTPQPWVALVTQHGYPHGFGFFLAHDYYAFQFIDGIAMPTWMHLWFVVYLIAYTLVLSAILCLPRSIVDAARSGAERLLASPLLLPAGILYVFLVRSYLPPGWSDTHGLIDDWSAHATYLAMFLFGLLLRRSEPLRLSIARWWPVAAVLAVLGYSGVSAAALAYPGDTPLPGSLLTPFRLARATQAWGTIVALFGIADRFWNRDHPWRATLAEGVFPFYIIHQTIILVVGYWLLQTATGQAGRFAILVVATAIGCWLFYWMGRSIGPLRPLIGLKRVR
jgi:glucans biosynthesis protein C